MVSGVNDVLYEIKIIVIMTMSTSVKMLSIFRDKRCSHSLAKREHSCGISISRGRGDYTHLQMYRIMKVPYQNVQLNFASFFVNDELFTDLGITFKP